MSGIRIHVKYRSSADTLQDLLGPVSQSMTDVRPFYGGYSFICDIELSSDVVELLDACGVCWYVPDRGQSRRSDRHRAVGRSGA